MSSTAGPDDKTTRHAAQDDATTRPVTAVRHDDPVRDAPVRDVDPVRDATASARLSTTLSWKRSPRARR